MNPLEIEMLLHFHCSPAPFAKRSPAAEQARVWLLRERLIQPADTNPDNVGLTYCLTQKGQSYVSTILSVPHKNEVEQLSELLAVALDDFESTIGVVDADRFPNHWTVEARAVLPPLTKAEAGR